MILLPSLSTMAPCATRRRSRNRRPGTLAVALCCLAGLVLGAFGSACSADRPLTPEQRAIVERLEAVEEVLGRDGYSQDIHYMASLRTEAAAAGLPVAEARARLILGRAFGSDEWRAHLELAAEAFSEHGEPGWEARAWLQIARTLRRHHLDDPLFASDHREDAVRALERAVRLARQAEDPLTEGEAHWLLGAIHQVEDARGPALERFQRAAESFDAAGEALLVVAARVEVARAYHSLGDLPQAEATLEVTLSDLESQAGLDELLSLKAEQRRARAGTDPAAAMRSSARRLRERGYPELADHMARVADFFAERGERLDREGWTREDHQAMVEVMSQAPRPRPDPPRPIERGHFGQALTIPLTVYVEEHPDQEVVQRSFRHAIRGEIDELDRQIRHLRLEQLLAGDPEAHREEEFARFLAAAEKTGYMPELPLEWFVRRVEEAPEPYWEGQAISSWVEIKAAELYSRLGRNVDGFRGIPPEEEKFGYTSVNAWQRRYCDRLKQAIEEVGEPAQFTCSLRNTFQVMAKGFDHAAHLDDEHVDQGTRIDALADKRRRLMALEKNPSRLEEEVKAGALSDFFDSVFYLHRNPSMAVGMAAINAPLEEIVVTHEVWSAAPDADPGRALEDRIGEVECALAQQRTLHLWLAEMAAANGYEQQAASHRAWVDDLDSRQREEMRPSALVAVGPGSDPEPVWGLGCGGENPSFVELGSADDASRDREDFLAAARASVESGRHRQALQALRSFDRVGIDRPERGAEMLDLLGRAHLGLGDRRRARDAFRRSVDALEEVVGGFDQASLVASYAGRASDTYGRLIELLVADGRHEEAFEYSERARARAFLHRLGGAPVEPVGRRDVPPLLQQAASELRSRIIRLENLRDRPSLRPAARGGEAGGDSGIERQLETVRREYTRVLERIAVGSGPDTLTRASTADLDEIRDELLPRGSVLVEYHLLPDRSLAWVVDDRKVELVEIELGAERLERLVGLLRDEIAERNPYRHLAGALYESLVAPVLPYVGGRPVILVPHGPLHHLPFGALWNRSSGRHLVEELTWTTIPSASSLRLVRGRERSTLSASLVLGDPDGTLPAARKSARNVARILGVDPLLGEDATEKALRDRIADADLLHIGTHAYFDGGDPLFSRLVLALASDQGAEGHDDGRLELYEIRDLDLRHVKLVTLSACGTAVGYRTTGDDVTTLQRAFLASGAGHVISTLWSIEDEAAAAWSGAFYERLTRGEPVAVALAGAQRELMGEEEWRHPFFWAAFVASGA